MGVRIRPLVTNEDWEQRMANEGKLTEVFASELDRMVIEMAPNGADVANSWTFDHVFGVNSSTTHVYEAMAHPVVDRAMDGFNGTIFACKYATRSAVSLLASSSGCL